MIDVYEEEKFNREHRSNVIKALDKFQDHLAKNLLYDMIKQYQLTQGHLATKK